MNIPSFGPSNTPFTSVGRNPAFLAAKYDYSCIGLVHVAPRDKVVTAVGEDSVVAAVHYGLSPGQTVNFVNSAGKGVSAKVVKVSATHGDIQVLEMDTSWMELDIKPAVVATRAQIMSGAQTLVFGETPTSTDVAAFGHVGYEVPAAGGLVYLISSHGVGCPFTLEPGDSGAPDFLVTPNGLALLGVHYSILPNLYLTSLLFPFQY